MFCALVSVIDAGNTIEFWSDDEDDLEIFDSHEQSSTENVLVTWLVLYLLRLQSNHYIPDVAIDSLLKFLSTLFCVLGLFSTTCKLLSQHMPHCVYSLKQHAGLISKFEQLVVCVECNSVYPMNDCIDRPGVSKLCSYKPFPRHVDAISFY